MCQQPWIAQLLRLEWKGRIPESVCEPAATADFFFAALFISTTAPPMHATCCRASWMRLIRSKRHRENSAPLLNAAVDATALPGRGSTLPQAPHDFRNQPHTSPIISFQNLCLRSRVGGPRCGWDCPQLCLAMRFLALAHIPLREVFLPGDDFSLSPSMPQSSH